jgi:hypothetical protein
MVTEQNGLYGQGASEKKKREENKGYYRKGWGM